MTPPISLLEISFVRLACEWLALAGCGLLVHEWIRGRKRRAEAEQKLRFLSETIPLAIARRNRPASKPAPADSFTPRESGVLYLLVQGLANKEIAGRLDLSESLVKGALQRLFAKTNVRTRAQLVKIALDHYPDVLAAPPVTALATSTAKPAAPHTSAWRPRSSRTMRRIGRNRSFPDGRVMLGKRRSARTE